jgi:hypothetical protein
MAPKLLMIMACILSPEQVLIKQSENFSPA